MRAVVPSWRVSDAVAYDTAVAAAARPTDPESDDAAESSHLVGALQIDGFDRAAVDELQTGIAVSPARNEPRQSFDAQAVLEREILPTLFGRSVPSDAPRLVLLGGEPGSGRSRAIARLSGEQDDGIAVVSPAILRAFLPDTASTRPGHELNADEVVAGWLGACLRHGRERRFPMLVDAPFRSPGVTVGLLESFRGEGFAPEVAVVAVSRAEILMAVTSAYLHRGARSVGVDVGAVDRSIEDSRAVLTAIEGAGGPTRVVVIDRNGDVRFDRAAGERPGGAAGARDRAAGVPMSTLQAAQWLSELRRITEFVDNPATRSAAAVPAVVALCETAMRDVIPRLSVPPGSKVSRMLESRIVGQLVSLRRAIIVPVAKSVRPTGPEAVSSGPDSSGPSR